jgi:hypothetical protein
MDRAAGAVSMSSPTMTAVPVQAALPAEGSRKAGSRLVGRLSRSRGVLVQPGFPAAGDPDPLGAVRADEVPQRAHEPGTPAAGQDNSPRRAVDRDEKPLHLSSRCLADARRLSCRVLPGAFFYSCCRARSRLTAAASRVRAFPAWMTLPVPLTGSTRPDRVDGLPGGAAALPVPGRPDPPGGPAPGQDDPGPGLCVVRCPLQLVEGPGDEVVGDPRDGHTSLPSRGRRAWRRGLCRSRSGEGTARESQRELHLARELPVGRWGILAFG